MTCKRGHNVPRAKNGDCPLCEKIRHAERRWTLQKPIMTARKKTAVVLPVADFGYIKPPTKAQLMARR